MMTTYAVPFPAPTPPAIAGRCPGCCGKGLSGNTYLMPVSDDRQLRIEEFCGTCQGCGAADHDGCVPGVHAVDPDEDIDDDTGPHVELWIGDPECPSCSGRGWCPVAAWNASRPDAPARLLRVPCGCVQDKAVPVDPADAELADTLAASGGPNG